VFYDLAVTATPAGSAPLGDSPVIRDSISPFDRPAADEVQILNSFGKEEVTQEDAGSLYGFAPPLMNACRKPGEWQVFDIRYRAPRRDDAGKITEKGTVTVRFNGKKVQDNTEFGEPKSTFHPFRFGNTPYLDKIRDQQKKTMTGPVFLQDTATP